MTVLFYTLIYIHHFSIQKYGIKAPKLNDHIYKILWWWGSHVAPGNHVSKAPRDPYSTIPDSFWLTSFFLDGLTVAWSIGVELKDLRLNVIVLITLVASFEHQQLCKKSLLFSFKHVFREANSAADFMARLQSGTLHWLNILYSPPQDMESLLLKDKQGSCPASQNVRLSRGRKAKRVPKLLLINQKHERY